MVAVHAIELQADGKILVGDSRIHKSWWTDAQSLCIV